jgi:hypothetical protein
MTNAMARFMLAIVALTAAGLFVLALASGAPRATFVDVTLGSAAAAAALVIAFSIRAARQGRTAPVLEASPRSMPTSLLLRTVTVYAAAMPLIVFAVVGVVSDQIPLFIGIGVVFNLVAFLIFALAKRAQTSRQE